MMANKFKPTAQFPFDPTLKTGKIFNRLFNKNQSELLAFYEEKSLSVKTLNNEEGSIFDYVMKEDFLGIKEIIGLRFISEGQQIMTAHTCRKAKHFIRFKKFINNDTRFSLIEDDYKSVVYQLSRPSTIIGSMFEVIIMFQEVHSQNYVTKMVIIPKSTNDIADELSERGKTQIYLEKIVRLISKFEGKEAKEILNSNKYEKIIMKCAYFIKEYKKQLGYDVPNKTLALFVLQEHQESRGIYFDYETNTGEHKELYERIYNARIVDLKDLKYYFDYSDY